MGSSVMWAKEEDKALLSRAWVLAARSEDAITATGQKASKFWSRVFEMYVELILPGWEGLHLNAVHCQIGNHQSRYDKVLWPLFTDYIHYLVRIMDKQQLP